MASVAAGKRMRDVPGSLNPTLNKISAILQITASFLWLPQAVLISIVVGNIANGRGFDQTKWLALGVLSIGILRATIESIGARISFRAARQAVLTYRKRVVAALGLCSPLDASRPTSGRAASVIAEQTETIVPYLAHFEIAKLRAAAIPAIFFLGIFSLSWAAAIVLLLAAPIIPIFMALIGWRAKEVSEAQLIKAGDMNAFLLDRLRGITTIRSLDAVDATARSLRADAESLRERTMAVLKIAFLSSAVLELFSALGVAMVAVYVGFHLLGQLPFGTWGPPLDLSEGMFILLLAPAFFEPLRELSAVWHERAAGQAALDELHRFAADRTRVVGMDDARQSGYLGDRPPAVLVENLSFKYAGSDTLVFDNFAFSVAPGEHVALLGPSGSGKSTLLALLAGLCPPASGIIEIGGSRLSDKSAPDLRGRIAWIGQRPHIFAGTLAGNVALGRTIDRSNIANALAFAGLVHIAQGRGSDAIGENGIGLSGGEALRLALARIGVDGNFGLIIADEPTAHLDADTAQDITDNLLALSRGKTLIVATHDLAFAARMGRIIRIGDLLLEKAA